jgi:hypothetical protein
MLRNLGLRLAGLLAIVAIAATGCSDSSATTAPTAMRPAAHVASAAAAKAPYISDVQLSSIYIDMGPDGTYDNGYTVTLTNPGPRATGLFFDTEVRQNLSTMDAGGSTIFCPAMDGVLTKGTCRMMWWVTPPDPFRFVVGPATLTIRLKQRGSDNSIKLLDSRTVDIYIVHS